MSLLFPVQSRPVRFFSTTCSNSSRFSYCHTVHVTTLCAALSTKLLLKAFWGQSKTLFTPVKAFSNVRSCSSDAKFSLSLSISDGTSTAAASTPVPSAAAVTAADVTLLTSLQSLLHGCLLWSSRAIRNSRFSLIGSSLQRHFRWELFKTDVQDFRFKISVIQLHCKAIYALSTCLSCT